jgi:hypothetical protein
MPITIPNPAKFISGPVRKISSVQLSVFALPPALVAVLDGKFSKLGVPKFVKYG